MAYGFVFKLITLSATLLTGKTFACAQVEKQDYLKPQSIEYYEEHMDSDGLFRGRTITPWSSESVQIIRNPSSGGCLSTNWSTWAVADEQSYENYDGYKVYPTEWEGIGYIVTVKDPGRAEQSLLNTPSSPLWFGSTPSYVLRIGLNSKIQFIATEVLEPGVYHMQSRKVATLWLSTSHSTNTKAFSIPLEYNSFSITLNASTCNIEPRDQHQSVTFPKAKVDDFFGVGSKAGRTPFHIQLNCAGGIPVYATFTDATNPNNFSDTLTLSSESTAKGIGIQIGDLQSNKYVYSFGPENKTIGGINQFKIATSLSPGFHQYNLSYAAQLVQTELEVTPGTFNAQSIITFAYK